MMVCQQFVKSIELLIGQLVVGYSDEWVGARYLSKPTFDDPQFYLILVFFRCKSTNAMPYIHLDLVSKWTSM